jgi:hypothetical protein
MGIRRVKTERKLIGKSCLLKQMVLQPFFQENFTHHLICVGVVNETVARDGFLTIPTYFSGWKSALSRRRINKIRALREEFSTKKRKRF